MHLPRMKPTCVAAQTTVRIVRVTSLPGGGPPDFFHAGPDDQGVYVLAGMPHSDEMLRLS